jgi:hypothetical protein
MRPNQTARRNLRADVALAHVLLLLVHSLAEQAGRRAATRPLLRIQPHADVDVPPAARVLTDIAGANVAVCETVAVPQ